MHLLKLLLKVPLVFLENIVFFLWPNSRKLIEKYIYNPYQFNEKQISYSKKQFADFAKRIGGRDVIKNKVILELGPGGSIGFGLLALQNGASRYLAIDDGQHIFITKKQFSFYKKILNNDLSAIKKLFIFKNGKVDYSPEFITFTKIDQDSRYTIESNSIDLIYSCAVLEHVHKLDLCFSEMTRVLKPGGIMNHQVDLRDHIFSQNSLWFLKISDFWFKFLFGRTGEYVNRKRLSVYKNIFKEKGLGIISLDNYILFNKKLPEKLLNKYSEDDLKILSFNTALNKCVE